MNEAQLPYEVDARGMRCPWPALRAARAMRAHRAIVVRADDARALQELSTLASENNWAFEHVSEHAFLICR